MESTQMARNKTVLQFHSNIIYPNLTIDPKLFDFDSIFRVASSSNGMKRPQLRTLRAEVLELAIEKYSGGQLRYVGDTQKGYDFVGLHDNLRYESKGQDGMFQKTTGTTKQIILKNFYGKSLGTPDQTFDYLLLWDTESMTAGICDWNAAAKQMVVQDANIITKVALDDIQFFAIRVPVTNTVDLEQMIMNLIRQAI